MNENELMIKRALKMVDDLLSLKAGEVYVTDLKIIGKPLDRMAFKREM